MHVAMMCHNFAPHVGGIETVVASLARELSGRHRVTIITTAYRESAGVERSGNLSVWRIPATHATERFGVPYPIPSGALIRSARREAEMADVFHAHGTLYVTTILAALLARSSGRPLILTEHVGEVSYSSRALSLLQSIAWRTVGDRIIQEASAVTACSLRVQHWLENRYGTLQCEFVPNGADSPTSEAVSESKRSVARRHLKLPQEPCLGLFVGRATPKKRLEDVLVAAGDGFVLVTCGAERPSRSPAVIDLGIIPHAQMQFAYAAADFLVHAGQSEGFPVAVQEAMSRGVPVVLRWDTGYDAIVDRSVVLACESAAELQFAVKRVAGDADLRRQLSERGKHFAENAWSWRSTAAQYERIYSRSVAELRERPASV